MKTPLDIIIARMRLYDPTEIVDLLNLTSDDLIDKFYDLIELKQNYLRQEFEVFVITDDDSQDLDFDDWDSNEDR